MKLATCLTVVGMIAAGAVLCAAADAQVKCDTAEAIDKLLTSEPINEEIAGAGLTGPHGVGGWPAGTIFQVYASENGGSWSLVTLSPDGKKACLGASGGGWAQIPLLSPAAPKEPM